MGDLIQMSNLIHGFEDVYISILVSFNDNIPRGHSLKLNNKMYDYVRIKRVSCQMYRQLE